MHYFYQTANPQSYKLIKSRSKEMRSNPTEAEALLWSYLKNKVIGHKIRRQHIVYNFVADFICLKQKTIIEVDGKIHNNQKDHDIFRTQILNQLGYKVIRFTNEEVMKNPNFVVEKIKNYLNNRSNSFFPPSEG